MTLLHQMSRQHTGTLNMGEEIGLSHSKSLKLWPSAT